VVRVKTRRWQELDKDDIPLEKLAQHFEAYNRSEGKSPRAVAWYSRVISYLAGYLRQQGYPGQLGDVDVPVVREFILYLQTNTRWSGHPYVPSPNGSLAAIGVQTYVRGLRASFSWLHREGYTEGNLLADLKPPKAPHKLVEVLTDDEIPRILSCLDPEEGSLGLSESLTDASTACNIATPIRTRNSGKTIGLSNLTIHHWGEHYGNQKRQGKRDLGTGIQNS
jgi:integrase